MRSIIMFLLLLTPAVIFGQDIPSMPEPPEKLHKILQDLRTSFGYQADETVLIVSIPEQQLYVIRVGKVLKKYRVSTSSYGEGSEAGSNKTPLGAHRIKTKYGEGATKGAIFRARRNTGEIARIITQPVDGDNDYVTSRIMWLEGLEEGLNKGGEVDSYKRYIYIHGTHEEGMIGMPASHGCVRMYNDDVIELFDNVEAGTLVYITNE